MSNPIYINYYQFLTLSTELLILIFSNSMKFFIFIKSYVVFSFCIDTNNHNQIKSIFCNSIFQQIFMKKLNKLVSKRKFNFGFLSKVDVNKN